MNGKTRQLTQKQFRLQIRAGAVTHLVQEVLDTLETNQLLVFPPDDKYAFAPGMPPLHRASLPIKIRDWLPVGCQLIRLFGRTEKVEEMEGTRGLFSDTARRCLFGETPAGPSGLECEIRISRRLLRDFPADPDHHCFKLCLAHELVHAFDLMRVAVPAVMDWFTFWRRPLQKGRRSKRAEQVVEDQAKLLDGDAELARIREFWPSQADKWFSTAVEVGFRCPSVDFRHSIPSLAEDDLLIWRSPSGLAEPFGGKVRFRPTSS